MTSAAGATGPADASALIRQRMLPTGTVSSTCTRISVIVPATGEGISASTLSVEISTRGSSTATVSPTCLSHSSTVPSATESPISGKATSTTFAGSGSEPGVPLPEEAAAPLPAGAGGVSGAAASLISISPRAWPTCTVSSGSTRMRVRVPEAGDGTSASTLSVDTSTIGSSAATVSPTCLSHSSTVPSVTDSPIAGMVI